MSARAKLPGLVLAALLLASAVKATNPPAAGADSIGFFEQVALARTADFLNAPEAWVYNPESRVLLVRHCDPAVEIVLGPRADALTSN